MARSRSAFVAPDLRFSLVSSAYSLKKYRCGLPGGGHGPPYPIFPKSFRPCRAPLASCSCLGTRSGSSLASAGRSYKTQCTHVPAGASGSSMMRAKLPVFADGSCHSNFGETSCVSHVNFLGIVSPSEKSGLVMCIAMAPPVVCEKSFPENNAQMQSKQPVRSANLLRTVACSFIVTHAAPRLRRNSATSAWPRSSADFKAVFPSLVLRSEEHTSELQSHLNLVCRL